MMRNEIHYACQSYLLGTLYVAGTPPNSNRLSMFSGSWKDRVIEPKELP
jgi:hypothetical protein